MFENLGNLAGLVKEAQKVQEDVKRIQADLAERIVEGSAGGGIVTARVNGQQELVSVTIDPVAVTGDDVEMLEDLIVAAVRQATAKSRQMAEEALKRVTAGLNLPGLV